MIDLQVRDRTAGMPGDIARPLKSELLHINMGPQHPSTHGVLRLFIVTDGEIVQAVTPYLGYLHRCAEKIAEGNTWAFMYISTAAMTGLIVAVMILVRPDSLWKGQAVVFPVALVLIVGSLPHRKGLAIALEFLVERHCRHAEADDGTGPPETQD